jgi:TonB family protein
MDNKRTRRFLIVAFALSLLIHLIATQAVRWPFRPQEEEVQVIHLEHVRTTRIAHLTTPPPHTPQPAPSVRVTAAPKKIAVVNGQGTLAQTATPAPTIVPPTPTAVPTPNCAVSDTPVQVVGTPTPPAELAPDARADRITNVARIRVIVDPNGSVSSATVLQSSGSSSMDLVAVSLARGAQYAPATHACKAIASDYTFAVKFNQW